MNITALKEYCRLTPMERTHVIDTALDRLVYKLASNPSDENLHLLRIISSRLTNILDFCNKTLEQHH